MPEDAERIEKLEAERDVALADAAAMREALAKIVAHECPSWEVPCPDCYKWAKAVLASPSPGRDLLEQVKRLKAFVATARWLPGHWDRPERQQQFRDGLSRLDGAEGGPTT